MSLCVQEKKCYSLLDYYRDMQFNLWWGWVGQISGFGSSVKDWFNSPSKVMETAGK